MLSQVFCQECLIETLESVRVPFPLLGLLELSVGIPALSSPLLDPSRTCPVPVCVPLCLSHLRGVGCGDFRRRKRMLPKPTLDPRAYGLNGCWDEQRTLAVRLYSLRHLADGLPEDIHCPFSGTRALQE